VTHQQFNIQQLYALPTLYLWLICPARTLNLTCHFREGMSQTLIRLSCSIFAESPNDYTIESKYSNNPTFCDTLNTLAILLAYLHKYHF